MGPARRSAHGSGPDHDDVLSSPTGCPSGLDLRSLNNLDSPSQMGTPVVSHADQATTTRGSGSEAPPGRGGRHPRQQSQGPWPKVRTGSWPTQVPRHMPFQTMDRSIVSVRDIGDHLF